MKKIKTAIVGAAGYSGEELLRLLIRHPHCDIAIITSRQYDGQSIDEVFPRFAGSGLKFQRPDAGVIAETCDLAFLALPHGLAAEFAAPLLAAGVKVIDISADFRLRDLDKYRQYYKTAHPAPELSRRAVYGMPELYRAEIAQADLIASPGCYCTSVILPSAPLLRAGLVEPNGIAAACMSGVSGAGRKVELPYIFPECNESLRAYAPVGHRHTPEIEQELAIAADMDEIAISFVPHLAPVNRGINSTIFFQSAGKVDLDAIAAAYTAAYADEPFTHVLPPGKLPDTKHVTMTNRCEIGFTADERTGRIIAVAAIDNLTKGASGQAVQSMNIRFGFDETTGLL